MRSNEQALSFWAGRICSRQAPAVPSDDQRLSGQELADIPDFQVEGRLEHGTFAGQHHEFVVAIVKRRTDAPGIAHGEHLAASRQAAHHIAAVEVDHRRTEDIRHAHVIFDVMRDGKPFQTLLPGLGEQALCLAVQAVSHQLQRDVGIAVQSGRLTLGGQEAEDLLDVGHVEVAAQAEVLRAPVVAAQERVDVAQAALSGRRIAQVAHVQLAGRGSIHLPEDLRDGIRPFGPLAEHVLRPGGRIQVDIGQAGAFLSPVVLLLHQQVQLVQAVAGRAVFLLL